MSTSKSRGQRRREVLVDEKWLRVIRENVRFPNGTIIEDFYTVERPAYAAVMPLLSASEILLVEQYRHGPRKHILNVPMGVIGERETPRMTARRELREETGYAAGSIQFLGTFDNAPSFLRLTCHLFLARKLRKAPAPTADHTERVRLVRLSLERAAELIFAGKITDMTTVIGILGASVYLRKR